MNKKLFNKYYKRLMFHGIIKALFLGLIVSFVGLLVSSVVCWIIGFKALWLCLTIFGGLLVVSTPIFYFVLYKPDTLEIARRIDETGLEERMITMTELDGDDSFIARMQREDAIKALKSVDAKLLKFTISVPVLVVLGCSVVLGIAAATVEGLYQTGVIEPGKDVIVNPANQPKIYNIEYDVNGDGEIDGDIYQGIEEGKSGTLVEAKALDGYTFVKWVDKDGNTVGEEPARMETNVTSDIVLIAEFQEISYDDSGDGEGDGDEGEGEGDEGDGEGKPKQGNDSSSDNGGKEKGDSSQGSGASSSYEENNQVYDGNHDYKSEYEGARDDAMGDMSGNNNYSGDNRDIASGYFDTIKN